MGKKIYIGLGILVILAVAIFAFNGSKTSAFVTLDNYQEDIKIYKSQSCGCCEVYSGYFKREGNKNADIVNLEDISYLKQQYSVPKSMESCHTVVIGDYFIEGHIPLEAVEKLLVEKPDIKGIAMPGMPSGSPGMPGAKKGDFVIYAVNNDGTTEEFMRI